MAATSGMSMNKATRITWEAHPKGRAGAKTCHKELAILYEERLQAQGLTVVHRAGSLIRSTSPQQSRAPTQGRSWLHRFVFEA